VHEAHPQTVGIRLENLKPEVRSYVQKLRASLQVIYDRYEVANRDELAAKVRKGIVKQRDTDRAVELMRVINDCGRKNEIVSRETEKSGEVYLEDIPTFTNLPSEAVFMDKGNGYKFDRIQAQEYREGRNIKDFLLTDKDLQDIGLDDPQKRQELLEEISRGTADRETEPLAKVFNISEAIAKKIQEDPRHPVFLTTKEVIEAIDEAGYRPATLQELLAFGKHLWKPYVEAETLSEGEKLHQHLDATDIVALASVFTAYGGKRSVAFLSCLAGLRGMRLYEFNDFSGSGTHFLVIRKSDHD